MTIQRLENVGIAVDDLAAAATFFVRFKMLGELPVGGGSCLRSRLADRSGRQEPLQSPSVRQWVCDLRRTHNRYVRLVRSPLGIGAPATRPAASAAAMACSSTVIGERPCSSAARSTSSNSGVTCQIVPW
jgi:hypothetical protein